MSKLNINCYTPKKGFLSIEKKIEPTDFLSITIEDILIEHHRRNAATTYFHIDGEKEKDKILFLVSQDKILVNEFNMLKPNPRKTIDIFEQNEQNFFTSISLGKLISGMESNQADYELDIEGRQYSFRLLKGIKVKNILANIAQYIDENESMKEYENKPKI